MRFSAGAFVGFGSCLALLMACGGADRRSGDRAGTENLVLTVSPAQATLAPGQSMPFRASSPWGGTVVWSVLPATGGSFTGGGVFTASAAPGQYAIVARLREDIRYTGTAQATVLPPPPVAVISPDVVSASGSQQGSTTGGIRNASVVGEPVVAHSAEGPRATEEVRHGYTPDTH